MLVGVPAFDVPREISPTSYIIALGTFYILYSLMLILDVTSEVFLPSTAKVTYFTLEMFNFEVDTLYVLVEVSDVGACIGTVFALLVPDFLMHRLYMGPHMNLLGRRKWTLFTFEVLRL